MQEFIISIPAIVTIKQMRLMFLQENVGLKSLNVSFNGFGTEGTSAMAHAIAQNRTLKHLDMSKNRITDIDVTQLTKQLKHNESLETLRVC